MQDKIEKRIEALRAEHARIMATPGLVELLIQLNRIEASIVELKALEEENPIPPIEPPA